MRNSWVVIASRGTTRNCTSIGFTELRGATGATAHLARVAKGNTAITICRHADGSTRRTNGPTAQIPTVCICIHGH